MERCTQRTLKAVKTAGLGTAEGPPRSWEDHKTAFTNLFRPVSLSPRLANRVRHASERTEPIRTKPFPANHSDSRRFDRISRPRLVRRRRSTRKSRVDQSVECIVRTSTTANHSVEHVLEDTAQSFIQSRDRVKRHEHNMII